MNVYKYRILVLLLLLLPVRLGAQEAWQHLEGMPCEETAAVMQDGDGYIWIGTRLGLVRYDGYRLQLLRNDIRRPHAFSSCNIRCLATDGGERIFAGSFFGLNTLHLPTRTIKAEHFEGGDYVQSILYDGSRLWTGTGDGLYMQTDGGKHSFFKSLPHDKILHLSRTAAGDVVVVTQHQGIFLIDRNGRSSALPGTTELHPTAARTDSTGTLWIGTERQGLYSLRGGTLTRHDGCEGVTVNDLLCDLPDGLLLATDCGVMRYPAGPAPALPVRNVLGLCRDREGNLWAATEGQGVYLLRRRQMPFVTVRRSFTRCTTPLVSQFDVRHLADTALWSTIPNINAIYEHPDGTGFVGTWNNGLYILRQGQAVRHLTMADTPWLKSNSIYAFCSLGRGLTLVATWFGIYLLDDDGGGRFVAKAGRSDLGTMHTLSVFRAGEDDLWLGLVGGIAHIRGDLSRPAEASVTVYTHVGRSGIAAPEDVGRLTDRHDDSSDDYQLGGIYRIVRDRYGRIWACTSEPGLLLYDARSDAFRSVSGAMGIPGDNVHSLDIDRHGDFWMTTNYGLLQMTVDRSGAVTRQHLYTRHDALPESYFGSTMSTLLADGSLCFLNQEHLITVRPETPAGVQAGSKTLISEILVGGAPLADCLEDGATLPPYTDRITLPYDCNNLTIRFTRLSFGREPSVRYSYRLDGVDADVRQTDMGVNSIHYNRLPPGRYVLHYGALGDGAEPDGPGQTFTVEILQPLWWRWWARAVYAVLLLLVSYWVLHGIIDRNRKNHRLEMLEVEKRQLDELYRQKTQFYIRVMHEFLTPLTLMSELTHSLHRRVRPSLQATLFMLTSQTDKLMEAMNHIVDVREDSAAQEALQKAREMTQIDRDFLRRCTESVNNHIADPDYSHRVMMQEVGASHATLYRKLKALAGMDATSFIRSIRMRAACQILSLHPDIRIGELAARVGYSNPKYFSTCFKSEFGLTPREYQNHGEAGRAGG